MIKVKTLITLVVAKDKEVKCGECVELEDKEANRLAELGYVELIKPPAKGQANGSTAAKNNG